MVKGFKKIKSAALFSNKVKKTGTASKKSQKKVYESSGKNLPVVTGSSSEYIKTITVLKRRHKSDEALYLLQKIASMVKPIMRSHGLKVTTLCEFFPKSANLLGLNVNNGMKICIRLRPHNNDKIFFPLTELLGTMLHELTHNIHGPHNGNFYSYMGELRTEMENLMARGYTGDGFFGNGQTVGKSLFGLIGRVLSGVPVNRNGLPDPVKLAEARKLEAERQKAQKKKINKKGQRLGSLTYNPDENNISTRELALRAAEQRIKDSKWCGKSTIILDKARLDELGMDDEIVEITVPEFVGNSNNGLSQGVEDQMDTTKKSLDNQVEILDIIDLTEE
jgi:hypothetical protein